MDKKTGFLAGDVGAGGPAFAGPAYKRATAIRKSHQYTKGLPVYGKADGGQGMSLCDRVFQGRSVLRSSKEADHL